MLTRRHTLLSLPWLTACGAPVVAPAEAFPPPLVGRREALDARRSRLRILVFRGGAAARLGHNHVLLAQDLAGELVWPDEASQAARRWAGVGVSLGFRLDALQIDPPSERLGMGPGFESELEDGDRAGTRANLLRSLEAEARPQVRLQTTRVVGEGGRLAVEAAIELHGRVRRQWFPVVIAAETAQGQVVIRQSDFGVQPFSVLGGLLAVRDELLVDFSLVPTSAP